MKVFEMMLRSIGIYGDIFQYARMSNYQEPLIIY